MRTHGILLVKDAILLLNVLPNDGECCLPTYPVDSSWKLTLLAPDVELGFWRQSCDRTLASLNGFSQNLVSSIGWFQARGEKGGAEVISSSCIACLAHLAILCEVVCQTDRVAEFEMHNLCDSALQRLGTVTSELRLDEYTYLDLLLGVRPSLCRLLTVVTQTGGLARTLGRNRYRSSISA